MATNIPDIRHYLTSAYNDEELTALCSDYFRDVNDNFTSGMTKMRKIELLLDYCRRRDLTDNLLAALERDRPDQFQKQFGQPVVGSGPAAAPQGRDPGRVFISHAHQDAEFAHRLAADLRRRGWRVWIAPESIRPGEKWVSAINRGLEESGIFVVALTPAAIESPWVTMETNAALALQVQGEVCFIPLNVQPCKLPALWAVYQCVPFDGKHENGMVALLAALEGANAQASVAQPAASKVLRIYSREEVYELGALLGRGFICDVYLGRGNDGRAIAVKIPHPPVSAYQEQRLWQELAVLEELAVHSGNHRYFPRAWRGTLADTNREVLCMDLVRGERLIRLAMDRGGALDEKLALDAGLQYTQMLEILGEMEISCPDRKIDDLYWDESTGQLTVLDWDHVIRSQNGWSLAEDLYTFGRFWYELMTGSMPSLADERQRRPLEDHPNWTKVSYGLQTILRRVLSPDLQQRYQNPQQLYGAIAQQLAGFVRPAGDLLRDAKDWLREAKMSYDKGMQVLHGGKGPRFYNTQETNESVQITMRCLEVLQQSRDQALCLADLARRRQVMGAEAVWLEAQDLDRGLNELVESGSRRALMGEYTIALQWLEVAEEAVAEDHSELLKIGRWRAVANAGQAAIARDLSLWQFLDTVLEVVHDLECGQACSAAAVWARLVPKLEAGGWRESDEMSKHLWSLEHEAAVWQAWEVAQRAEEVGQYKLTAQYLRQVAVESEKVVYAGHLLAVLGHTPKSLVAAAEELLRRTGPEERASTPSGS